MPISTENAGALLGKAHGGAGKKIKVKFLKQARVHSLGRNSAVGEVALVSESDARFLCAYRYAERYTEEASAVEKDGITLTGADLVEKDGITLTGADLVEKDGITLTGADLASSEAVSDEPKSFRRRRG